MVKYCIVVGCINSEDNIKLKNNLKPPSSSLFTVPKNPEIIKEWSQILGQDIEPHSKLQNYICDKHFHKEYIIRKEVITIPGQKPFVSERKKIIFPILNKKKDLAITPLLNTPVNGNESTANKVCKSVAVANNKSTIVNRVYLVNNKPVNVINDDYFTESNVIREAEYKNIKLSESHRNFSISDVMKNLETQKLPKKWSWVDDQIDPPAVILCLLDYKFFDIKFRIRIDKTLNIFITNVKINQTAKMNFVIASMKDFWKLLELLQYSPMCSGSGFENEKSAESCSVFLKSEEAYKKQAVIYRCTACRQLRRKISKQSYRPKLDVDETTKKLKRDETEKYSFD